LDRVAAILEARNITNSTRDLEASEITVDGEMTDIPQPPPPPEPINVTPPPPPPPDTGDDLI
jgi:hypothetical protein